MKKKLDRSEHGGYTLVAFIIGTVLLMASWGVVQGLGVMFVVFSVVGEVQRKANQVIDQLEREQ